MSLSKRYIVLITFIFCFVFPAFAEDKHGSTHIEITGEGKSPLKPNASIAKKTALIFAKRDAVERGLGAMVSLGMLPNKREVIAKTESSLSYEITKEEEKDGFLFVSIRAKIDLENQVIDSYPLSDEERDVYSGHKPLIEKFPQGEVNWQEGFVIAYGRGEWPAEDPTMPGKAELAAQRAALTDSYARALEIINGIRIDMEKQIKGLASQNDLYYKIEGAVKNGLIIKEEKNKPYRLTLKVPLTGIKGISFILYNQKGATALASKGKIEDVSESEFSGIVIDARGTGVKPALFPKIIDPGQNNIYSVEQVEETAFIKRGVIGYALSEEEAIKTGRVGDRPLIIQGKIDDYPQVASLTLEKDYLPAPFLVAEEKGGKKRRQGNNPLTIKSTGNSGALNANIVISAEDAKKIAAGNKFAKVFKESRVIVLTDSAIGGTEGNLFPFHKTVAIHK